MLSRIKTFRLRVVREALSIRTALVLTVFAGVTIPAAISFYLDREQLKIKVTSQLVADLESASELFATSVQEPLWNYAKTDVDVIIAAALADKRVLAIEVWTRDGKLFSSQRRNAPGSALTQSRVALVKRGEELIGNLVLVMDGADSLKKFDAEVEKNIVRGSQTLVGSLLLILLLMRYRLVRPIRRLVAASAELAKGNLAATITSERKDELGQLADSMEATRQALASSFAGLELRVQQRTAALSESNESLTIAHRQATQALDDLRTAQAQLVQAEKMASLGQLVTNVAHEINTPIGAVKSSGESIAVALVDALENLPKIFQTLDPEGQKLFMSLINRASGPRALLSSREDRALQREAARELDDAGIGDSTRKAQILVQLNAPAALSSYLPLLRHNDCDMILDTAHSVAVIINCTSNINAAVNRVSKIVSTLKSFSQVESTGEMLDVRVQDGIESVLANYQNQIRQGIELVCQFEAIPKFRCLPDELSQVWTHLIHNALQAMDRQGKLTLGIRQIGDEAVVTVSDTGCGIQEAIRDRIFEPFFSTRRNGEGSGLGLDIVKKIINKHHGRIDVQSEVGVGTTFAVYLPLPATKLLEPITHNEVDMQAVYLPEEVDLNAARDEIKAGPWKVLIVDDDVHVHAGTKYALGKLTYQGRPLKIFTALSGAAAREILSSENDIALALIDVVMETENSGLELVRFIRDELANRTIRLVLRTGQPGKLTEHQVLIDYDLDDYKLKTELTKEKLTSVIVTNLRSYANNKSLIGTALIPGQKPVLNASAVRSA